MNKTTAAIAVTVMVLASPVALASHLVVLGHPGEEGEVLCTAYYFDTQACLWEGARQWCPNEAQPPVSEPPRKGETSARVHTTNQSGRYHEAKLSHYCDPSAWDIGAEFDMAQLNGSRERVAAFHCYDYDGVASGCQLYVRDFPPYPLWLTINGVPWPWDPHNSPPSPIGNLLPEDDTFRTRYPTNLIEWTTNVTRGQGSYPALP